jgi:hypothetical protein
MHDADLVLVLELRHELVGVDNHAFPAFVVARVQIEDQYTRLDGYRDAHQRRYLEVSRSDDALLGQEQHDALAQAGQLRVGVDGEEGERLQRLAPQRVRDRRLCEDAPLLPVSDRFEHRINASNRRRAAGRQRPSRDIGCSDAAASHASSQTSASEY